MVLLLSGLLSSPAQSRNKTRGSRVGASSAQKDDASRLRSEGLAALQAARFADAARLLSAAYAAAPGPQGLHDLGRLALAEKRELDAHDLMRRYLADPDLENESEAQARTGTSSGGVLPEIKEAEQILSQQRPPAGTLNILGERGTRVYVDGRLVGVLPLALPLLVSPREHSIVLELHQKRIEDTVLIPAGRLGELRSDVSSRTLLLSTLPGVLVVSEFSGLSPELQARLRQSVEKALLSRRVSPLGSELAVSLLPSANRKLGDCLQEPACQVELAKQVEAEAILQVHGEIEKETLHMRVRLIDTAVEQAAAMEELRTAGLVVEQAGASLLAMVSRVYEQGSGRPRAELAITCEPADAALVLDGTALPSCRYGKAVFAGEHSIFVNKPGYASDEQRLTLRAGEKRRLDIRLLEAEPAPAALISLPPSPLLPRRQPRPAWRLALGSVVMMGGLVTAGFGIAMLSIHDQCVQPPLVDGGTCERRYVTKSPGVITLSVGLGVAIAGGVLVGIPGPRK